MVVTTTARNQQSTSFGVVTGSPPLFPFTRPEPDMDEERECSLPTTTVTTTPPPPQDDATPVPHQHHRRTPQRMKNRTSLLVQVGVDEEEEDQRKTASHLLHRSERKEEEQRYPSSPTYRQPLSSQQQQLMNDSVDQEESETTIPEEEFTEAQSQEETNGEQQQQEWEDENDDSVMFPAEKSITATSEIILEEQHEESSSQHDIPDEADDLGSPMQDYRSTDRQQHPGNDTYYEEEEPALLEEEELLEEHKDMYGEDIDWHCEQRTPKTTSSEVHLLVLTSSFGFSHQSPQQRCLMILEKSGYAYETLDGALHKDLRNYLWSVSGLHGVYPQCFVVRGDNVYFVGDIDAMDRINDASQMEEEVLEGDPSVLTWDRLMAFDPGEEEW